MYTGTLRRITLSTLCFGINDIVRGSVQCDGPQAMLDASPKGTIPVLVTRDGQVIDESLDVMMWALAQNDPENWLSQQDASLDLVASCDNQFKPHLDRYKYATRYEGADPLEHRAAASAFLNELDARLQHQPCLTGQADRLADMAIFPFVRQFASTDRDWFASMSLAHLQRWLAGHVKSARFKTVMPKFEQWQPGGEEPIFSA